MCYSVLEACCLFKIYSFNVYTVGVGGGEDSAKIVVCYVITYELFMSSLMNSYIKRTRLLNPTIGRTGIFIHFMAVCNINAPMQPSNSFPTKVLQKQI